MRIGVVRAELRIYRSNSLKEKRKIVRSIIDKLKKRFNISCAEIDDLEFWQRSTLGIALVSNENNLINRQLSLISEYLASIPEVELIHYNMEII